MPKFGVYTKSREHYGTALYEKVGGGTAVTTNVFQAESHEVAVSRCRPGTHCIGEVGKFVRVVRPPNIPDGPDVGILPEWWDEFDFEGEARSIIRAMEREERGINP